MGRVSHDHALFERAVEANREAEGRRARALLHVTELCGEGRRREVLPWLLPAMRRDQALGRIRLWRLDQAMYGTTRARALRWIRRMRETIGDKSNTKDGYATLDWALHDQKSSVRMTTWLWLLMVREHEAEFMPPDGFPYRQVFDPDEGDEGKENHSGTSE